MTEKTLPRDRPDTAANHKIPALPGTFRTTFQKLPIAVFHPETPPNTRSWGREGERLRHPSGESHRRSVSISGRTCHPPWLFGATFSDYTDKLSDSVWRNFCWFVSPCPSRHPLGWLAQSIGRGKPSGWQIPQLLPAPVQPRRRNPKRPQSLASNPARISRKDSL